METTMGSWPQLLDEGQSWLAAPQTATRTQCTQHSVGCSQGTFYLLFNRLSEATLHSFPSLLSTVHAPGPLVGPETGGEQEYKMSALVK